VATPRPEQLSPEKTTNHTAVLILSIITIVGVLVGVAGILAPRVFSYERSDSTSQRKDIVARTTDFAVAYNTYKGAEVADYQQRLKGLLSTSYDSEFVKVTDVYFKTLSQKKQISDGAKVLQVAVSSVGKSTATALLAVDASVTNTDVKAAVARHFRWKVSLVKQKGEWRIDGFEPVAVATATTGQPSATTPTPTPTAGGN
jgi:hypothetical protein